ncbi:MAG: glycosyl hydrolase family 5 [Roseococcus sp.]|nr:glycosyl hydrolase family 5 [Roseococcus sp.]
MPQTTQAITQATAIPPAPRRRSVLRGLLGLGGAIAIPGVALAPASSQVLGPMLPAPPHSSATAADRAEWAEFRARFISPEGRVVDNANQDISHSEGQGYAMLMAEWAGDRASFELILQWTRAHLSRPRDALFAWRWSANPRLARDTNSATDGDIMIAWALQRAAERWSVPAWRAQAEAIARDVLRLAVREVAGRTVLLPGPQGFEKQEHVVLNPSYYNTPGLRALARLAPHPAWSRLDADGQWLLAAARFGRWELPADWIELDRRTGAVAPAAEWAPRFSWDAIRVPLFQAWAGEGQAPALGAALHFWTHATPGRLPAWTDLRNGALAPYQGHAGVSAIANVSFHAKTGFSRALALPGVASATDYYGAALVMLARIAKQEGAAAAA